MPGSARLLGPVDPDVPEYVWNAAGSNECSDTEPNRGHSYYLKNENGADPTGPSRAPSVPQVAGVPGSTSITVYFTVGGVTGLPYPRFSVLWGTTTNPLNSVTATKVAPTLALYVATVSGLTPSTAYYFKSVAANASGTQISAVSAPYTTSSGAGTAPTPAPAVPTVSTVVPPTNTTITIEFSVAGVTGTPAPTFTALIGQTTTPTGPLGPAVSIGGNVYRVTATGLTANTTYYFSSVATNGVSPNAVSAASAGISTAVSPAPETLQTLCHHTFLVPVVGYGYTQGGTSGKVPINAAISWMLNGSAPNGTDATTYGDFWCKSWIDTTVTPLNGATTTLNGTGGCYNSNGDDYATISNAYLGTINSQPNTKLVVSLGGFYGDLLGMFGPYTVPGVVSGWVTPSSTDLIDSIRYAFYNDNTAPNPMQWSRASWGAQEWDGLNIDFENIGAGGQQTNGPWGNSQWPPTVLANPQACPSPTATIGTSQVTYSQYTDAIAAMLTHHRTAAPTKLLTCAPISLSINGTLSTNITSTQNGMGSWFAFPAANTVPSDSTFNTADSNAMLHPKIMRMFDSLMVQFYNEAPAYYLGGTDFTNLVAQWGYVAMKAQALNNAAGDPRKTRINIGLACGLFANITEQGPPPPAAVFPPAGPGANQGPTPPSKQGASPAGYFEYWFPAFGAESPPNDPSYSANSPSADPGLLKKALDDANSILLTSFPGIKISDWCSGCGFWAGNPATAMAKNIYTSTSPFYVPNMPTGDVYLWGEQYFPANQPGWQGNVPIVPS